MGQIQPIEGSASENGYFVQYDEDQWNLYDDAGKQYCYEYWKKKAKPMGVAYVALRLVPDPLFPSGPREAPYIAWQYMFPVEADVSYTTKTVVHVTLLSEPTPRIRHDVEAELATSHPKGSAWRAYWNDKQVWNGRV